MSGCCDPNEPDLEASWRTGILSTLLCGIGVVVGWVLQGSGAPTAAVVTFALAYVAGGWEAFGRTAKAVTKFEVDVDLLMLLAAVGAATVGHWLEGAVLLFLFSLGTSLETYAFGRTRRSIGALMELRPETAARITESGTVAVAIDALEPGVVIRVRPGERIPADAKVKSGTSRIDESTLTGEPVPVAKEEGSEVFAGTLNGSGSLDLTVLRRADDSALARIIRMVEEARETKAPTQSWIEDVEGRYALGVIAASVLAMIIPWTLMGWTFESSFYRAMTLLVVASPCALVISIPATIVSAVSSGARKGVLFKGGAHLDALADIRAIAFDKTGTLTVGRPELDRIVTLSPVVVGAGEAVPDYEAEVLRLIASAESRSEHPLASAILASAEARGIPLSDPTDFEAVVGQGVSATVDGVAVAIGRRSWIEEISDAPPAAVLIEALADMRGAGTTPVLVALDGATAAALSVADLPRPGAREALDEIRSTGISHVAMLTGDDRGTAGMIGEALGVDQVHAELLPDTKTRVLGEIRERHGRVAMVGDGVNDAPALATADVGIALGAAGTDVALETADVVVMGERLDGIAHAIRLSQRARTIVRQNLVFSVGVMVALVALAISGNIGLTAGVIGHEGSTVIVVFNGLRLLADPQKAPALGAH
jgi:Zn2+/Cd2+-exporting ATPase